MSTYGVIVVHTTSAAMRSEKVLARAGLEIKLIPIPRQYSTDCGIAIRFLWQQANLVEALLTAARVDIARLKPLL